MNNYNTIKERPSSKLHFLLHGILVVILSIVVISCNGADVRTLISMLDTTEQTSTKPQLPTSASVTSVISRFSFGPFPTFHYEGNYKFTMEAEIDEQTKSISFDKIIPNVDSIPVEIEIPQGAKLTANGQIYDGPIVSFAFDPSLTTISIEEASRTHDYTLSLTPTKLTTTTTNDTQRIDDGNGGFVDAVVIFTEANFEYVRDHLRKEYVLVQDITITERFNPIAPDIDPISLDYDGTPFTGIFDGNEKTIHNLNISIADNDFIGFFGYIGSEGEVRNLKIVLAPGDKNEPSIYGYSSVGALAGKNSGHINNVGVEGGLVSGWGTVAGGLVGYNEGLIENSYSTGTISGPDHAVGGLVGYNSEGVIRNSYATGAVFGTWRSVGGLVGYASGGMITASYATGAVSGHENVGGLVGKMVEKGIIQNSYATGTITGQWFTAHASRIRSGAGGLVGDLVESTIKNSYATGMVSGDNTLGGLVGFAGGHIESSYFDAVRSEANQHETSLPIVGDFRGPIKMDDTAPYYTHTNGQVYTEAFGAGNPIAKDQFSGWDFTDSDIDGNEDIWYFPGVGMWPRLAWQQ